jgi:3-oxoacyl-[acyl-carrier protein] reductase
MDLGIKNKVAVVLAASKGLGRAAAESLAAEGCRLAVCSRDAANIIETARDIEKDYGIEVLAEAVDVRDEMSIKAFIDKTSEKFGEVDILVTNAGGPPVKPFMDTTEKEWHYWYDQTFMSVVRSIKAVIPYMQKNKWGRIINITSVSVKAPVENLIYSNALRMAVIGLSKTLASELGPSGITVNNVAPGYHSTDGLERVIQNRVAGGLSREEVLKTWTDKIPLRRIGVPEDLADLITFLASDRAAYMTGTTIQIDGGMYTGTM